MRFFITLYGIYNLRNLRIYFQEFKSWQFTGHFVWEITLLAQGGKDVTRHDTVFTLILTSLLFDSMAIIYGVFSASNLIAPSVVAVIGPQLSLFFSGLIYR